MRILMITLVHLLLLAGVCVLTIITVPQKIQTAIHADVHQQLVQKQLTTVSVAVDGRSLTLTGQVASLARKQLAIDLAQQRPGVASVVPAITVTSDQ